MLDFTTQNPDDMGKKCFDIMLFIVLAISQVLKSGCVYSFPPSNKVGCSVISIFVTDFRKLTRRMSKVYETDDGLVFMKLWIYGT